MTHAQLFEQAVTLTGAQLGAAAIARDAQYAMRVSELIRLNYQAVVLAWNEVRPDDAEPRGR